MRARFWLFVFLCSTFGLSTAHAKRVAAPEIRAPQIEVVFVLDTTGSMGGLIQAAKEKIWAIANTLAQTDPTPNIKMGLLGYRDRGDAYVTVSTDLSDDLDAMYVDLMNYRAGGGGDGPESVNQALYEAVSQFSWSDDSATYRVIFLVGDAPPHMDYAQDVKYAESVRLATQKGIIVNTIQCGSVASTTPVWQEIARLAEGEYFRVEQTGSAILASTPLDADLGELARELDKTRVYYGSEDDLRKVKEREKATDEIHSRAPSSALARRSVWNASAAGKKNFEGDKELVGDLTDGRVDLDDVPEAELPAEVRALSSEERGRFFADKQAKRDELQEQIQELGAKRQAYIEEQVRKNHAAEGSLDHGLYQAIRTQAEKKGLIYETGPAY